MKKLSALVRKYRDAIVYIVFGGLTTLVNWLVYYPCLNLLSLSASVSTMIAWAIAVVFAYLTNKPFVFRSNDWSLAAVLPEAAKFVGCRLGSGALETGVMFVAVDLFHGNGNFWKIPASVLVVILNYFAGKLVVFREK